MEYDVAPEDRERSINCSQQKFYNAFQQHQHNSVLLGKNMKTATTPTNITEITAFQPIQYATNSSSKVTTTTTTTNTDTNHSMSAAATAASEQKYNSSVIMEAATSHINLIDDEEEKDPLALDSTLEQQSQLQDHITVKHTHSLRRHIPRIIVKPIPPEKKTATTATATTAAAVMTTTTITSHSSISPSSRTSSSRRIQQQQQAKAAAAAAAAATATLATSISLPTATTFSTTAITQASTMREVLASIPGFSLKPRRRSSKKISTAAQIEQTKDGKIDLETPDSILASTNLRALLNKQTFSMLPPLYQYNLIQLLPSVDREAIEMERKQTNATTMPIEAIRLGTSNLNNEFFARACLEWRERLSEGEFTPENQVKLKTEAEREKNKLDPWKLKHFEPIWGEKAANRACSSNSSISSNKSSIDTCNIAITNSSSSGSGSGSGSGSCKSLGEQKLEFKLESKGALTATIVNATSNALNIKETPSLEVKQETKSIIECRLDQHNKATEVLEVVRPITLTKQDTDKSENSASGKEYVCKEEKISTHLQQRNKDELKCDKQTEMYEKIDAVDQGCFVDSEGIETSIKREPPSVFDLLRMQGNLYEHEAKQQKRGTKRSSDSISASALVSAGTAIESDNNKQQLQQQQDGELSDSYNMESKQLKIEITNKNVPKQSNTNFVTCAVSSDAPTTTTTNFQKASSSTAELEVAEEVAEDETSSCNAIVQNTTFTQEILDSYAAVEQQLHLHFLQKQEHLKAATQQITTESELELAATPTAKLQYFAQIQPTTTTNQNIINNINSTCDSMKDAFNEVEKITAASSNQTIELQQIVAAVHESPRGGDAVDLIEQNFADAENYVLQSGDASTDSGDTLNVQNSTAISAAPTGNKNNLNEGDFIFSSSLDHVIGSDDCDNLYDNNKAMLPTSISSATTSSSSSSSSSSTSSSPTTSSAVTTSDMQEIISAANSMSNTLFQAPQQLQQQQQQQQQQQHHQQQHHQPQRLHQEEQQQPIHGCNIMSSSGSTTSTTSRHNEMFQHVQHDWNFGGLKLHQTNEKYLNTSQDQSTAPQQQQHILQSGTEDQEDDEINDDNEEEVDECVLSHTISNDVAQHIIEDEPEDDDEMDDSDAVRDIVDELQQQHQQLLQEQQQEHLHQQLQLQEQQRQEQQQQQQFPAEQLEYSNEMSESLSSDVLCDVPMSAAEMEVTSTVVTNSNSNDDSSNELNLFNNSAANISNPVINHIQHMPPQPPAQTQQQRQILVDSNGQIIRNFLMQQQQLQQQQQLLQHAQQLAAFQTNQHHQTAVTVPQPPQQPQTQQQLIQHTQPQPQQQQHQPQKTATLSMQVIRRQYDNGTNGQQQLFQHAVSAQPQQQQQHPIEQSNQHQIQHFALQQQQQRNFIPQTTNAVSQQASTSNNLMPSQQIQLQTAQHQQQQHHHHHQHHQQQQQQQHHHHLHHQQQHQHQQMPTFQNHAQQQPKFISKQLNIISMPRSSVNITSSSAATPSAATAYYNTSPAISAALPTAATAANNLITAQQQQQHAASNAINSIKTLPSTPVGIPSTIAQQRLIMTKLPSGKGRKATNNKLPPGAVNLERSYQICQAVIQNSPNRESLKAQLRPPSAILGQQQSSGGSSPSSTSLSNSCSSASSSPSSSAVHIKNEEIIASSTTLPTGMPPNVMGVGRPNVYKVIGPRMGFPRKKYVQRQPSPTMIRHVYAAPPGTVNMSPANSQQLNVLQQQQQQHHPHHHPHIQLQAPPPQHELHQNGSGQYVLVHRANVGAADNQAPRASSAPPVPQNQHQFHGMNGIPITGRGRPASVDVDTSNTVHEIQQTIHGANPANIVRRNISAGNITYIDNYSATAPAALVDGSNYIVATASAAQPTDNSGENTPPTTDSNNCACSLNAMVICQQCGAFCHDDCVSATKLCVSCVIR